MNERIEKKLSKRLVKLLPITYSDAWKCEETNVWCVGGGLDYWGEGQDEYTVWESFLMNYYWILDLDLYPEGHKLSGYPNIEKFRPTVINLFKKIKEHKCQAAHNSY